MLPTPLHAAVPEPADDERQLLKLDPDRNGKQSNCKEFRRGHQSDGNRRTYNDRLAEASRMMQEDDP